MWKLRPGRMVFPLCAIGAYVDKFKMSTTSRTSCQLSDNELSFFITELMDLLLAGADQSQANQPNNLANLIKSEKNISSAIGELSTSRRKERQANGDEEYSKTCHSRARCPKMCFLNVSESQLVLL
eukprot:1158645-Pelagomonas_calceolata.AAC.11